MINRLVFVAVALRSWRRVQNGSAMAAPATSSSVVSPSSGTTKSVKGILKTSSTIAAKREVERRSYLDSVSKEILFKVSVEYRYADFAIRACAVFSPHPLLH